MTPGNAVPSLYSVMAKVDASSAVSTQGAVLTGPDEIHGGLISAACRWTGRGGPESFLQGALQVPFRRAAQPFPSGGFWGSRGTGAAVVARALRASAPPMLNRLIDFAVHRRATTLLATLAFALFGISRSRS